MRAEMICLGLIALALSTLAVMVVTNAHVWWVLGLIAVMILVSDLVVKAKGKR